MREKIVTISDVSRETGYCTETIRNLERRGVIKPMRDTTGRRLFLSADIRLIRKYRANGVKRPAGPGGPT